MYLLLESMLRASFILGIMGKDENSNLQSIVNNANAYKKEVFHIETEMYVSLACVSKIRNSLLYSYVESGHANMCACA